MRKIPMLVVVAMASCAEVEMPPPAAPAPPPVATWDDAAEQELRAEVEKMHQAWQSGDMAAVRAMIAEDGTLDVYRINAYGRPVKYTSVDEMIEAGQAAMEVMQATGASVEHRTTVVNCQATATFGACTQEFQVEVKTRDGKTRVFAYRGTGTARKGTDGWKWTHLHASYASAPPPPPTPPPIPYVVAPRSADLKKLDWTTPPGAPPGVKMAVVWEHPETKAQAAFMKLPRKFSMDMHHHTANLWMTVLKGSIKMTLADGTAMEIKAGGYGQAPAGMGHRAETKRGATVFRVTDGAFDRVMADEPAKKGKPDKAEKMKAKADKDEAKADKKKAKAEEEKAE